MVLAKIRSWYGRYERPISSLSLIGGFVFDAIFLKRVDLFWENFWVVVHIVIVGACIVLIHSIEREEGAEANPSRLHFWLVNIQQFFYGGIWSVFLVFYFRSGDFFSSWPFLLILALSFLANERLKRSFIKLSFQIALFFLAIFCFAIFLIPVLLHRIGSGVFLLSGAASLAFITLFLLLIRYASKKPFENKAFLFGSVFGIFALVNILYFTNLIPPIPLSVKDAGVYYSVSRNAQGNYAVEAQKNDWRQYFNLYPDFAKSANQPVFVYSAVFAPAMFKMDIIHEWQYYDPAAKKWLTISSITLPVAGGREGGFRTYSEKFKPGAGRWRVNILTAGNKLIGRVRFNINITDVPPGAVSEIKI